LILPSGLSVWEPTGRPTSAAASTTTRYGGSGLSRNPDRSVNWMTDPYRGYRVVPAQTLI
jgi:hypothetical protein